MCRGSAWMCACDFRAKIRNVKTAANIRTPNENNVQKYFEANSTKCQPHWNARPVDNVHSDVWGESHRFVPFNVIWNCNFSNGNKYCPEMNGVLRILKLLFDFRSESDMNSPSQYLKIVQSQTEFSKLFWILFWCLKSLHIQYPAGCNYLFAEFAPRTWFMSHWAHWVFDRAINTHWHEILRNLWINNKSKSIKGVE